MCELSLTLMRIAYDLKRGTAGRLYVNTSFFCSTIERPDLNADGIQGNEQGQSCIPAGDYVCKRTWYYKGGYETFEVTNVPGRSRILFHVGNTAKDVQGCIALGRAVPGDPFVVVNSRATFKEFMSKLEGIKTFQLTILNNPLTT